VYRPAWQDVDDDRGNQLVAVAAALCLEHQGPPLPGDTA
jgi:hypothetical protein